MGKQENIEKLFLTWKFIEKKVFSPVKREEIIQWVRCYTKFLYKFWELPDQIDKTFKTSKDDVTGNISFPPLNLEYSYSIFFNLKKFEIAISLKETDAGQESVIKWENAYDDKYFTELDYVDKKWSSIGKINQTFKKMNPKDIDIILKGVIVHPAIHQHIKCFNFPHHIRIGNAVKNPFLFLYQLAFQLGDCFKDFRESDLKKGELDRIEDIVWHSVINGKKTNVQLSAGSFFDL